MSARNTWLAVPFFVASAIAPAAWADDGHHLPNSATYSTLVTTPLAVEGLTGDKQGNLYAPGRAIVPGTECPVWRVNIENPSLVLVGRVPAPNAATACLPLGLAFDHGGKLYVADADRIYSFFPDETVPPLAAVFASGVPGANGVAFDESGNLWTSDGTTGQGRVWKIDTQGTVTEIFRIQPMANEVNLTAGVGGVGRDVRDLPPGTITVTPASRNAANTLGSQPLVANGLAFGKDGDLFVADTSRGAIWKVKFDRRGNLRSSTGCDTTFTANTLCLENVLVAHPLLEGADGIALDREGTIWVSVNERNAIVGVTENGRVTEIFRNAPDATTQLRNTGPLEFPTSPFLSDRRMCAANSDVGRRDNFPNAAGEANPAGPSRGKISCLDQRLSVRGMPLPVR